MAGIRDRGAAGRRELPERASPGGRRASAWPVAAALLAGSAPPAPAATLTERSEQAGIDFRHHASPTASKYLLETMGGGIALLDFDQDGWLDILFVNSGAILGAPAAPRIDRSDPRLGNRLYRNNRDGTFSDATGQAGIAQTGTGIYGMGAATGDYDNDGRTDLLITGYGGARLFRNAGGGAFVDATAASGIEVPGWSASAGFADLDSDGLLDLVVTRYLDWSFAGHIACGDARPRYCSPIRHGPVTSMAFANRGGSRFEDVSEAAGLAALPGKALGVAFNDLEGDGDIDIVLANDSEPQQLLCNQGGFVFEDCGLRSGVAYNEDGGRFAGMGIDFEDYDNDGRPDILITNLAKELYALYRNEGGGFFAYRTRQSRLAAITATMSGWGVRFADLDLDGWKDVFAAQGHVLDTIEAEDPSLRYREPPLFARGSHGRFEDVSAAAGEIFARPLAGRGAAFGDLDNDGDIDVVMGVLDGRPRVLYNDAADAGRHWIALRLVGVASARDGQGARVSLGTADGTRQDRFVTTAGSYLSASDPRAHFGLGSHETVAWIRIQWPSGREQQLHGVEADRILTVREAEPAGS